MLTLEQLAPNEWCFRNLASTGELEQDFDRALEDWDAGQIERAESLLRSVVSRCPWHIDAIHHLGLLFEVTDRLFEAQLCARERARVGLKALPPEFSWLTGRMAWGSLDNRPFMRA